MLSYIVTGFAVFLPFVVFVGFSVSPTTFLFDTFYQSQFIWKFGLPAVWMGLLIGALVLWAMAMGALSDGVGSG